MSDVKKIGTIQDGGDAVTLIGVKLDDGRWHAAKQPVNGQRDPIDIHSETTFGKVKEATAQMFASPKLEFVRDQPNVTSNAGEPADTDTITDSEADEVSASSAEPYVEPEKSEAEMIREYMADHPDTPNKNVVEAFAEAGVEITSSQVSAAKRQLEESE